MGCAWSLAKLFKLMKCFTPSESLTDQTRTGHDALYKEVGSWLKSCPKTLCHNTQVESSLVGATMISDQHFKVGKMFNNINFITLIKHPTGKRKSGGSTLPSTTRSLEGG
jgi:hypothetical protein